MMFRRKCVLLVFCLSAANAVTHYDELQTYPKCCNKNKIIFASQNASAECIELQSVPRAVLVVQTKTKNFSFLECTEDDFCIDVDEDGRVLKVSCNGTFEEITPQRTFAKCCPLKHSYDPRIHTCVKETKEDNFPFPSTTFFTEIGLENCGLDAAIKDIVLEPDDIDISKNGSLHLKLDNLKIDTENFCVDSVHRENYYIARVCDSVENVCKHNEKEADKVRCLRKCCADGENFVERKCTRMFDNGINLTKFPFDNPTGKYKKNELMHVVVNSIAEELFFICR